MCGDRLRAVRPVMCRAEQKPGAILGRIGGWKVTSKRPDPERSRCCTSAGRTSGATMAFLQVPNLARSLR